MALEKAAHAFFLLQVTLTKPRSLAELTVPLYRRLGHGLLRNLLGTSSLKRTSDPCQALTEFLRKSSATFWQSKV